MDREKETKKTIEKVEEWTLIHNIISKTLEISEGILKQYGANLSDIVILDDTLENCKREIIGDRFALRKELHLINGPILCADIGDVRYIVDNKVQINNNQVAFFQRIIKIEKDGSVLDFNRKTNTWNRTGHTPFTVGRFHTSSEENPELSLLLGFILHNREIAKDEYEKILSVWEPMFHLYEQTQTYMKYLFLANNAGDVLMKLVPRDPLRSGFDIGFYKGMYVFAVNIEYEELVEKEDFVFQPVKKALTIVSCGTSDMETAKTYANDLANRYTDEAVVTCPLSESCYADLITARREVAVTYLNRSDTLTDAESNALEQIKYVLTKQTP